jgi:hypothetical protein
MNLSGHHNMLKGEAMAKEFGAGLAGVKVVLAEEAARLAAIKAKWTPPEAMAAAPVAPAAGPKVLVPEYEIAVGGIRRRVSAHWRDADVFDQMERDARRAHERQDGEAVFASPYSPGQLGIARHYRALTERHDAGGMRCASLEAGRSGGAGGSFIDAFISEGDELRRLHQAIGSGVAMAVRRVRPSVRGGQGAGIILDRYLVDAVCLGQMDLNTVLARCGWSIKGQHRKALRVALAAALDRMQGYRGLARSK